MCGTGHVESHTTNSASLRLPRGGVSQTTRSASLRLPRGGVSLNVVRRRSLTAYSCSSLMVPNDAVMSSVSDVVSPKDVAISNDVVMPSDDVMSGSSDVVIPQDVVLSNDVVMLNYVAMSSDV